tara:strand:- start:154 stop:453 length:300 start_codon:yes stop_codon:yes gene_type:complete
VVEEEFVFGRENFNDVVDWKIDIGIWQVKTKLRKIDDTFFRDVSKTLLHLFTRLKFCDRGLIKSKRLAGSFDEIWSYINFFLLFFKSDVLELRIIIAYA